MINMKNNIDITCGAIFPDYLKKLGRPLQTGRRFEHIAFN